MCAFIFSEDFVIFSCGTLYSMPEKLSVTVLRGNSISLLNVDYPVVDFVTLRSNPWTCGK